LTHRIRVVAGAPLSAAVDHRFLIEPEGAGTTALKGRLRVPGDKSISHRSIMLGAIAEGETEISGFLEGADALATLAAFRDMGVQIQGPVRGEVRVRGVGLHGLQTPEFPLDMGNSGTSMRLLAGLLAGQSFPVTLIGDDSLSRRPMRRVTEPLVLMGAHIGTSAQGTAPLALEPADGLRGIDYAMSVASAQVKSSLLLAGLYAEGETCVTEPAPTRDHTERMLSAFGYPVRRTGNRVCLAGGGRLQGCRIQIPADISSAAFFLVGASIAPGSDLTLQGVGINPTRVGVINILESMGADIELMNRRTAGGEPVADLRVRGADLKGIVIPVDQVPLAIDEFPALFIAAACAAGETLLRGAEELRVKESDRIQVMADGLRVLGVRVEPLVDGIRIQGGAMGPGTVEAHGDHRIAMAFAIAGLRAAGPVEVRDCANVETSFPGFASLAAGVGLPIRELRS
jgi:3-phosphoshikimate 1-carboxyvinyltransferase